MTRETAIDARGVRKVFGKGALAFEALKGVDFHVGTGEFVMLAGPSGSGKTTLLSILGCVLSPTAGEVHLCDERVSGLPEAELPRVRTEYIGFIFQGHNLIASLTAEDNVALQLELRGLDVAAYSERITTLLASVRLTGFEARYPYELSGGMQQRAAFCQAMVHEPDTLLLDEPLGKLDAMTRESIRSDLQSLWMRKRPTVVFVTHDNRIFHLADRIVHIEDGLIQSPALSTATEHV